jgi:MHS family proline/betaine transporter-like MFS transporter
MPFSISSSKSKQKGASIQMTPSQSSQKQQQQQIYRGKRTHHDCLQPATKTTTTTITKGTATASSSNDQDEEEEEQTSMGAREEMLELPRVASPLDNVAHVPSPPRPRPEDEQASPPSPERDDMDDNDDDDDEDDHAVFTAPDIYSPTTRTSNSNLFRTVIVSAGNVLVWYDFAIFGFFSDVLGKIFFPPQPDESNNDDSSNNHAPLMESFAVFGVAFLMRPIGGLMFGYIGDTQGRKRALEISIFLMAVATLSLGCLPTYSMVGNWAIPMLIAARMLQGLSVGGHLMSSLVYTCERCSQSQWGWYGSFVVAAANFGTLLAGLSAFALQSVFFTENEILQGAWRIPFLLGVLVIFPGCYLCFMCHDEDLHHGISESTGKVVVVERKVNPLREAFRRSNLRSLLSAAMVPVLWSGGFYLSFVWMATYMKELVHPPVRGAFAVNSSSLFLSVCIGFPLAGRLSDTFGRKIIMTFGGASMGILGPILVMAIAQDTNPLLAFLSQSIIGISLSCWGGPMCAWLVESFEPAARLTSVATGYNLAQAIIGGFTPLLATAMVKRLGVDSPGFILSALSAISLTGLWIVAPQARHGSAVTPSFQNVPSEEPSSIISENETALDSSFSDLDDKYNDEEYLQGRELA